MTHMKFIALPTSEVRELQSGGLDAHGHKPEYTISDGQGNPCRHCLKDIPDGEGMLILSYRPFDEAQPYAETGPIFLCANECDRHNENEIPEIFAKRENYLLRGYTENNRIVYGSGQLMPVSNLKEKLSELFKDSSVSYGHLRSSGYNCFQCRVES